MLCYLQDLKEFMDNAKHGVILFSMGSNLQSTDLDETTRSAILRAFAKLKQQVIWKWEDENLPGKPDNVKIMKWCPQNDIMGKWHCIFLHWNIWNHSIL